MARDQRLLQLFVAGAILLALVLTGQQLWTTDFGMDDRMSGGRRIVTEVDPGGAADRAGIVVGDEIVADPGLITWVEPWTEREMYEWNYRLGRAIARGHAPMRIRHDGTDVDVDLHPEPAPSFAAALRQLRRMGTHLPTTIAFLGVAALLARRRSRTEKDERARRLVVASCAFFGPIWTAEWPSPGWPPWLYPVSSLLDTCSGAVGVILLTLFAWSYPVRSPLVDSPIVRRGVIAVGALAGAYSSANSLHLVSGPFVLRGNATIILFDSVLAAAIIVGLVWQRRKAADVVTRRQTTWLIACLGAGMFVPILFLLVPGRLFGFTPEILQTVLFPFPLLIPLGFAAVVARYRLFSFDGVVLRAGAYAVAVATSLVVCVALTLGLQTMFAWRAGSTAEAARWLGIVAAVLLAEPVRRGVHVLIDRAFARDRDAFLRRCAALAARLAGASDERTIEAGVCDVLDAKTARVVDLAEILGPESAREIRASLAKAGTLRVVELSDPSAVDALTARGFELVVDAPSEQATEERPRVLALALPGAAYRMGRAERDALALVGRVIGASLAQREAQRALEAELVRSKDERRHIAMELHDGLGATLTAARLMARRLRESGGAAGATNAVSLDALDATLREGLGDLRASLSNLEPCEASWDGFTARLRRQASDLCEAAGVELAIRIEGEPAPALAPAARLALLRVVREAVNNALKHASPRQIEIQIRGGHGRIELTVDDDGTGLAARPGKGRGLGNMTRRIESLAGSLRLEAREGGGTRVAIALPLAATDGAPSIGDTEAWTS